MTFKNAFGIGIRRRFSGLVSSVLLLCLSCLQGCQDSDPTIVEETHRLAEEHGFNVGRLFYALDLAEASGSVDALVVERHGVVVGEAYAPEVPSWSLLETYSVTGSVTSLLVGSALDAGYLESLDQTLGELLEPWEQNMNEEKAGITLHQLLTMTSGVSRPERTMEEWENWMAAEDQVAWVLNHPLISAPGENYNPDAAAVHLLSAALTQATGKNLAELARESIMVPLEIPWADWQADSNGHSFGGFGLRIRTRDLVKFARLILNQGRWKEAQVLSPTWVQEATRPHLHPYPDYPDWGFGYLWKSDTCGGHPCIYSSGYGGQILVAVPDLDLAIALNSRYPETDEQALNQSHTAWGIIIEQIIPSAR